MSTRRRKGQQAVDDDPSPGVSESGPTTPLLSENAHHDDDPSGIGPTPASPQHPLCYRVASSFVIPLTDETGSPSNILKGLLALSIIGALLGVAMPKDQSLPTPWYRLISSITGYSYFCAWSISFYPQVILNFKRKSTAGLSNEFSVLNVAGFACYTTYTLCFYFSPEIQRQYKERNGAESEITVQSNDVAFAVHALVLCCIQFSQIVWYRGFDATPLSIYVKIGLATLAVVCVVYAALVMEHLSSWLDFLYMLSFVKVAISLVKYIPQVILNYQRHSTMGWNVWNVVLDCTGGTLSIGQQVGDSVDLHDFSGIMGNPAKFALGFVSIFFDLIFFLQHYVLYPDNDDDGDVDLDIAGPVEPLLDDDSEEERGAKANEVILLEQTLIVDNDV